jgi:Ricin-type beta-trefoil lectin domain-like
MGVTVNFSGPIELGRVGPGQTTAQTSQSATFSTAINNLTAKITDDTNHVFSLLSLTCFELELMTETPDPGEVKGPTKPVKVETAVQKGQSKGATPLPVASGQYVVAAVQFAPIASTPDVSSAALVIQGDGLDNVSVPITGRVGEVTLDIPTISVVEGKSTTVKLTVTLRAGPDTEATLSLEPLLSLSPQGILTLKPASVSLSKGKPVTCELTASAGTLAAGSYAFSLKGSAFGGAFSFGATVNLTIELPYFYIKNALGNVMGLSDGSHTGLDAFTKKLTDADNQLWRFLPDPAGSGYYYIVSKLRGDVVEIHNASTEPNSLLDVAARNVAQDGYSGSDHQLWYFVADPAAPSRSRIASKLNGNVVDVQNASSAPETPLDSFPAKVTGAENQQWTVEDGDFPSIVATVPFAPFWGNGNVNYILDGNGDALTGVSVTVEFASDFSSSANGYGFQLNCYSTEGPTTVWQQYVVYANPDDNQLSASVDNWTGTFPSFAQVCNIRTPLATLPSPTIPAGYSITIALTYYQDPQYQYTNQYTAIVSGAVFTVKDRAGNVVGTTTIQLLGQSDYSTGQPLTISNLAPIAGLQFCIVGDYDSHTATLTQGSGKITYYASSGFTATQLGSPPSPESIFHSFSGTGENANVFYGPLPWPWSISMGSESNEFVQLFQLTPGGLPAVDELRKKDLLRRHGLPAPSSPAPK